MRDPKIEFLAQEFATGYNSLELPDERDRAKKLFAEQIRQRRSELNAYEVLLRTGEIIGEDMTIFLQEQPTINPLSREQAIAQVEEAQKGVPWYRRGVAKVAAGAQWWQDNITEPSAAISMAIAAKTIPGEQPFEARLEAARQRLAAQGEQERKREKLTDWIEAATEAYHDTDTVWGLKGALELVVDPLNLVGLGIPGRAIRAACVEPSCSRLKFRVAPGVNRLVRAGPPWKVPGVPPPKMVLIFSRNLLGPPVPPDEPPNLACAFARSRSTPEVSGADTPVGRSCPG